ncbi:hypothetical protein Dimus_033736 [Dionaea muscipula]
MFEKHQKPKLLRGSQLEDTRRVFVKHSGNASRGETVVLPSRLVEGVQGSGSTSVKSKLALVEKKSYSGKRRTLKAWRRKEVSAEVPIPKELNACVRRRRMSELERVAYAMDTWDSERRFSVRECQGYEECISHVHRRLHKCEVLLRVPRLSLGSQTVDPSGRRWPNGMVCAGRRARVFVMLGEKSQRLCGSMCSQGQTGVTSGKDCGNV